MIYLLMSLALMAGADGVADAPNDGADTTEVGFTALSLEELCVQHEVLSDRLSRDFIKMKMSQLEEEEADKQIAAKAAYNRTVQDLNAVTLALGTRTCPDAEGEEAGKTEKKEKYDFPPLMGETEKDGETEKQE